MHFTRRRFPECRLDHALTCDDIAVHRNKLSSGPGSSLVFAAIHECIPKASLFIGRRRQPGSIRQDDRPVTHRTSAAPVAGHEFLRSRPRVTVVAGNHIPRLPLADRLPYLKEEDQPAARSVEHDRIPMRMLPNLRYCNRYGPVVWRSFGNPNTHIVMPFVRTGKPCHDKRSVAGPCNRGCVTLLEGLLFSGHKPPEQNINTLLFYPRCDHAVLLLPRTCAYHAE